jgi:chromosome segregation ATPase
LQALTTCRELENKQIESSQRIDELIKQLTEANDAKNRLTREHAEFLRRNTTLEYEFQQLSLHSKRCGQELDDARLQLENEILVRNTYENKARATQIDLDAVQAQLEEETEAKNELNKAYTRLQDDFKANVQKVEKECEIRIEGIEDSK